jgi:hypothetical protein
MWLEINNESGEEQGWVNLDNIDRLKVVGMSGQYYYEVKLWQGTSSYTYYISYNSYETLMFYFRSLLRTKYLPC